MKTIKTVVLEEQEYETLKKAQAILSNMCCEFEQGNEMEQCDICPMHFCCGYYNHSEDTLPNDLYDLIHNLKVESNEGEN